MKSANIFEDIMIALKYDWSRLLEDREMEIRAQLEPYGESARREKIDRILDDALNRLRREEFYNKCILHDEVGRHVEEYRVRLAVDVLVCVKLLTEGVYGCP